jgi:hypothetical protein
VKINLNTQSLYPPGRTFNQYHCAYGEGVAGWGHGRGSSRGQGGETGGYGYHNNGDGFGNPDISGCDAPDICGASGVCDAGGHGYSKPGEVVS